MTVTFEHRCPATAQRDDKGRRPIMFENCRSTQTWELFGNNACTACGYVPDGAWRLAMAGKLGIGMNGAEAGAPSTASTARRGRQAEAEAEA